MSTFKERSQAVLSPVLGRYAEIEYASGKGVYLTDTEGNQYLDFSSGIGVTSTGHCHPSVVKAIQDQAATLIHPCIGIGHYDPPIRLAEKLTSLLPNDEYSVFFSQSGSEAVEAAIKLARFTSKRTNLVAFNGGFHGRTYGALSLTSSKKKYWDGYQPLLSGIDFFPYPNTYRCPWGGKSESESIELGIKALKESSLFNDKTAAVIIEPILGEGGYVPAPAAFLNALSEICKRHDILLIFDEIQSGMGRTGAWFSFQEFGLDPDIITVAKGLASGMPLGACIAKKSVMNLWPAGAHGGTYGGNPVTCAASNATIDIIESQLSHVNELGIFTLDFLKTNIGSHENVGDIRGKGLMVGIEIVQDKLSKNPNPDMMKKVIAHCLENRLIVISCGVNDNVIRLIPPLIISKEDLIKGLSILVRAFK